MIQKYQRAYAERHHIPVDWVLKEEKLELAAFLEEMLRLQILTVRDARNRFCNEYPEARRIDVPLYKYQWIDGTYTYKIDQNYRLGSVINLIQPFDDSIYGRITI